ncbi:MAG TPA: inositol monophosphatase family protein [Polyangiaceae bacterium]|nr:inositol monophosphatase family protein [Polyangiaceae bacterium]
MLTPEELASVALRVATEAAALVGAGFRSRPVARKKGPVDLVTDYDLASEELLRKRLSDATPGCSVVAEEQGASGAGELVWYCDPLDGTTNFVHGHPFWAVSVGAFDAQGPLAGAVVAPALDIFWTGYRGGVARRNGETCCVSVTEGLADALIATGFPLDRKSAPDNNFDAFFRVKRAAQAVRRCGSAAIDLCLVADGTYDAYWERRLNPWDVAGGASVVLAAGGTISALDGGPCRYELGHILASNGRLHSELVPLIS